MCTPFWSQGVASAGEIVADLASPQGICPGDAPFLAWQGLTCTQQVVAGSLAAQVSAAMCSPCSHAIPRCRHPQLRNKSDVAVISPYKAQVSQMVFRRSIWAACMPGRAAAEISGPSAWLGVASRSSGYPVVPRSTASLL